MYFISPPELRIKEDIAKWLERSRTEYYELEDFNKIIKQVDAIYVTRIQDEYDDLNNSTKIDYSPFHLTYSQVEQMKSNSIVMHPLPRRDERVGRCHEMSILPRRQPEVNRAKTKPCDLARVTCSVMARGCAGTPSEVVSTARREPTGATTCADGARGVAKCFCIRGLRGLLTRRLRGRAASASFFPR